MGSIINLLNECRMDFFFFIFARLTMIVLSDAQVKAWVADKDAEALRCQKLLVEEEEAAQKK